MKPAVKVLDSIYRVLLLTTVSKHGSSCKLLFSGIRVHKHHCSKFRVSISGWHRKTCSLYRCFSHLEVWVYCSWVAVEPSSSPCTSFTTQAISFTDTPTMNTYGHLLLSTWTLSTCLRICSSSFHTSNKTDDASPHHSYNRVHLKCKITFSLIPSIRITVISKYNVDVSVI